MVPGKGQLGQQVRVIVVVFLQCFGAALPFSTGCGARVVVGVGVGALGVGEAAAWRESVGFAGEVAAFARGGFVGWVGGGTVEAAEGEVGGLCLCLGLGL